MLVPVWNPKPCCWTLKNSFTLGSASLSCTLSGSLPTFHFTVLIIGHLENTGSLDNAGIPNVKTFYCAVSRHHSR